MTLTFKATEKQKSKARVSDVWLEFINLGQWEVKLVALNDL